jgi:hypothetical protein
MQEGNRRIIAAADEAARRIKLHPGIAHAQSLVLDLHVVEAAPKEDKAALEQLTLWCTRYSPPVTPDPPDGVFIPPHAERSRLFARQSRVVGAKPSASAGERRLSGHGIRFHSPQSWCHRGRAAFIERNEGIRSTLMAELASSPDPQSLWASGNSQERFSFAKVVTNLAQAFAEISAIPCKWWEWLT